jgi:hypothetical protein
MRTFGHSCLILSFKLSFVHLYVPHSCDRFSKENIFESVMAIVEIIADFLLTKSAYFVS